MRTHAPRIRVLVALGLPALLTPGCFVAKPEYEHEETRDLVRLVHEAAALVETKGEAAFAEFNQRGSKWFRGDDYVYVIDLDGVRACYPPHPEQVGRNVLDAKDVNGKPVGRWVNDEVKRPGHKGAWMHFQWPKPDDPTPCWKSNYFLRATAPSGKSYVVLSGRYEMKIERKFITDTVEDAVALIRARGKEALDVFRDKSSKFIFRDVCVFVTDAEGTCLVNPSSPAFEGRNVLDVRDADGRYATREILEALKHKEAIWAKFRWPAPEEPQPVPRLVYVGRAMLDGKTIAIGAGFNVGGE